jgi:hypothetical protein
MCPLESRHSLFVFSLGKSLLPCHLPLGSTAGSLSNMQPQLVTFLLYATPPRIAGLPPFGFQTIPPRQSQSQSYFTTGGLPPISSSWRKSLETHD